MFGVDTESSGGSMLIVEVCSSFNQKLICRTKPRKRYR